jgi:hypothetical protein
MGEATPRVISVTSVESVKLIDGGFAVAIEVVTPDDRPFAVLLSADLAVELKDKLETALHT